MKLDLSKFKHIESDDKHATLQHPAGHTITIAIHALGPEQKEAFKAMARGGDVLESEEHKSGISTQGKDVRHAKKHPKERDQAMDYAKAEAKGRADIERHNKPNLKGLANGGNVADKALAESKKYHGSKEYKKQKDEEGKQKLQETLDQIPGKRIKAMAEGGNIPSGPSHSKDHSADFAQYGEERDQRTFAIDHGLPCLNPNCKSNGHPHPNCRCYSGSGWNEMAEGGQVDMPEGIDKHFCHAKLQHMEGCQYYAEGTDDAQPDSNIDPTTGQPDTSRRAIKNQPVAQKAQEAAQSSGPSLSDAVSNISSELFGKAEGGPVNTLNYDEIRKRKKQMNQEEANKPIVRKKYAEGEQVSNDDWQGSTGQMQSSDVQPAQLPPQQETAPEQPMVNSSPPNLNLDQIEKPDVSSNPLEQRQQAMKSAQQEIATTPDENRKRLLQEQLDDDNKYGQDLANGHITPKTYREWFHDRSLGGKIGTLFGILVSGMGSGFSHQPNAVMEMINKEIDNDYKAQVESKKNAQNFYKLAQEHALNMANAQELTQQAKEKAYINGMTKHNISALHDLVSNVNSMPEGTRKQAARMGLGMVAQKLYNKITNLNDLVAANTAYGQAIGTIPTNAPIIPGSAQTKGTNQPSAQQSIAPQQREEAFLQKQQGRLFMNTPEAKALHDQDQERHVPNVGDFSGPVPDADRRGMLAHQKLDANLNNIKNTLANYKKLGPADKVNPYSKARIDLEEQITKAQSDLRNSQLETVYRTGEQPLLDKILRSPPAGLLTGVTNNQVDALRGINNRDFSTLKKSKGIVDDYSKSESPNTIERKDPQSGRTVIYDAQTKKPLRFK